MCKAYWALPVMTGNVECSCTGTLPHLLVTLSTNTCDPDLYVSFQHTLTPTPYPAPFPGHFFFDSHATACSFGLWSWDCGKEQQSWALPQRAMGAENRHVLPYENILGFEPSCQENRRQPLAPSPSQGGQKKGTSKARRVKVRRVYLNKAKKGNRQTARDAQCTTYHGCHHAAPWLEKTIPSLAGRPLQALGMTSVWYRICHRLVWSSCPGCGN